jgi:hypothetical protein
VTFAPKPKALDPFLVMRFDLNILRNPSFNEGRQAWLFHKRARVTAKEG